MLQRKHLITWGLLLVMMLGIISLIWVFNTSGVVPTTSSPITEGKVKGNVIPAVTLSTLDGQPINLREDRGKVTILFAMSYWCTTCVAEAQALSRLYDDYEDQGLKVVVIDLDPDGTPERLQLFIDQVGDNRLIWAFDTKGDFFRQYNVRALDTTIVVNADGYEVYRDIQPTSYNTLQRVVESLL
jgi:peroxiredoxin